MLGSSQMRAGEILKRGGFGVREHDTQRPLKPRSFGPFLGGTKKDIPFCYAEKNKRPPAEKPGAFKTIV